MMNNDHTCTIDLVLEMIFTHVDRLADENKPKISFESSGIGAYEFQGYQGFDSGETFPVAGDCLDYITMELENLSDRLIRHLAKKVDTHGFGSFVDVVLFGRDWEITVRCPYWVEDAYKTRGEKSITINLIWDEDLEEL